MQAIVTKALHPTDTKGARIKVKCQAKTMIVSWDHSLNVEENHKAAARILIEKLGWDKDCYSKWYAGALPDGTGYAIVFSTEKCPLAEK
jgi:hypothetical protein